MKIRNLLAAGFSGLMTFTLCAQQAAPAPHKTAGSLPTLAETMQLIQDQLNKIGKLSFVVHIQDQVEGNATVPYSTEVSNVVADAASCTIRYHWKRSMHGDVVNDEDVSLSLHDVLGLAAMSDQEHQKMLFERERSSPDEKQTNFTTFEPPLFMVVMREAGDNETGFSFADQKAANSVARAMARVVDLCGGKSGPL